MSAEDPVIGLEQRDRVRTVVIDETTGNRMTTTITTDKPFHIDKKRVYEAYKAVKSNRGAAGVDGQTLEAFEKDLKGNLYRIWNRMSSGSYFPPPVRAVSIPKKSGDGERILGVPTVGDRIAQMVVKQLIEPDLDPIFLPDSYGYRPNKSALDAIGVTRERCWKYDWVLEFDIKGLFDNLPSLQDLMRQIRHLKIKEQVDNLNVVLRGHYAYYGIAGNIRALQKVYRVVERYWRKMLCTRSRAGHIRWAVFHRIKQRTPLLRPKLYLPYRELQALVVL